MALTFREILDQLEAASLDTAEKGNRFERLMRAYLKTDPQFADIYEDVWLWMDYPGRNGRTDTGIDLVAKGKDGSLTAIQCKFFAPTTTVSKPMLDSFLAASSKAEFTNRLIISTSDKWGKNAEEAIEDQYPPVARLRALDLSASPIDWSQFSIETPEEMEKLPPKTPRPYQREAIDDVIAGFETADRGKLIMACGTGKTFTALKLAEEMVPEGGSVLFLAPSISLVAQTVREWTAECERPLRSFAVCSDVKVGKRKKSESEDISVTDLAFPATTDGEQLAQKFYETPEEPGGFTTVFSTYQSIGAIGKAQNSKWGGGIPEFDLIICDEAHRTTGVTLAGEEESAFTRVHANSFVEGKKRLYMTATPRVYGEAAQSKAVDAGAILADMGDPTYYGEEFHRLNFATAVEQKILTDYKVLVLAVDEGHISRQFQGLLASGENELGLEDAAKLVGCWNGLAKRVNAENLDEFESDPEPMSRAVAFAGNIKNSKMVTASFNEVVENEGEGLAPEGEADLNLQVKHVDGTQNVLVRNEALDWLREDPGEGECRILSNAKCLSEGVDVPALDAVLFLAPRKSQVDVVQSVGRVMRKPKDGSKKFGYVILPIAVPADAEPEQALNDNERYKVVWQVLQALRSHDERLDAIINKLDLTGNDTQGKIPIIGVGGGDGEEGSKDVKEEGAKQLAMAFPHLDEWRDSIFARIVKKVGSRQYWDTWAKDIARIAEHYITRIKALVEADDTEISVAFEEFLRGLQDNLNPQVDQDQAIEMLAQHLITRPVFDALFEGYSFSDSNPVSISMQKMLDLLDLERLEKEQGLELDSFYKSVRDRAAGIKDASAKQGIVKDLYETFFRSAFKDMADRLGIVYTPVEIVDFILNSADEALREHFGKGITDEGVHVLDPFTGTGTFIVRLIQSGLIKPEDLERKFRYELHANEIVLLAYYVAAINIEEAYHGEAGGDYQSFEGIVLTDTFQMHEEDDQDELPGMESFPENNERVKRQKEQEIRVIVGNPPYSVGQTSGNDDNQNLKYTHLDSRIEETYAAATSATNKNSLYDSYIRAIRLASDRIGTHGVVCMVSNGGFLDGNTADGLRKSLVEEFNQISVFNLRGNQRTAGERSRKEGGKIFGGGSRATIAITLLVKDPGAKEQGRLLYRDIGDYLTRDEKLAEVAGAAGFSGLELERIEPNEFGDWLNQRDPNYLAYPPIGSKDKAEAGEVRIFETYSRGLATARDSWVYSSSRSELWSNVERMIDFFNDQVDQSTSSHWTPDTDPTRFSWNRADKNRIRKRQKLEVESTGYRVSTYRPFNRQQVYFRPEANDMVYQLERLFPAPDVQNYGFYLTAPGAGHNFSLLAVRSIPDLAFWGSGSGQFFPRYSYIDQSESDNLLDVAADDGEPFRRIDNITDGILAEYRESFGEGVTKDDIFFYVYGLLHSPDYRERFQADLKKMLPRIPKAEAFHEFFEAGRRLSELHLGYESVDPRPLAVEEPVDPSYRVKKMKFAGKGKDKDRSTIIYNDQITVAGIPEEAYRYMLGSRSAIEWIMDRYQVKTDNASGIVNDPNDWAEEHDDPRYILDLLCRIVTVSVETMKIVDSLPPLEIIEEADV